MKQNINLPREAVDASSWKMLKPRLDRPEQPDPVHGIPVHGRRWGMGNVCAALELNDP